MKAAVSSRIQMNSSASVATSTLTVPASLRLAIRKIGTLALRARTARSSSVACSWPCVVLGRRPVEQDAVDAGVGRRRREAVLARQGLDDFDVPGAQLRHQSAHAAPGGARVSASPSSTTSNRRSSGPARASASFASLTSRVGRLLARGGLGPVVATGFDLRWLEARRRPRLAKYVELRARRTSGGSGLLPRAGILAAA